MSGRTEWERHPADTARFVAELRGVTPAALAETTTANFRRLFSKAVL